MRSRVSVFVVAMVSVLAVCIGGCATQAKGKAPAAQPAMAKAPVPQAVPVAKPAQPTEAASSAQPAQAGELKILETFKIGGEGRWDLLTVDGRARRVYIGRSTRVQVIDADKGTVIGEVADIAGAHGVAVVSSLNRGFATAGKDGAIVVFDLETFKTVQTIKAGVNPDAILYDWASKKVFAFNAGSGDATVVNTEAMDQEPTTLALGGKPELAATDGNGHVYVNIADKSEVAVIDSGNLTITARWPLAPGADPTGLALDRTNGFVFAGCGNQKMIVLDTKSGKVVADVPVGSGVDGAAFDQSLGVAVCPNGRDGTLTVVKQGVDGKFTAVQTLTTMRGARTIAADRAAHRFYLPCMIPGEGQQGTFGLIAVGAAK